MSDPWMKFYPSDWRGSTSLKMVSLAARGLWIEMLCVMHEANPYGHLVHNGRPISPERLAAMVSVPLETVVSCLQELEDEGVFSRKRNGLIFSNRMEKDEKKRRIARENGKLGGNPTLGKQIKKPASVNQKTTDSDKGPTNPQIPEARIQKLESKDSSLRSESSEGLFGAEVIDLPTAVKADQFEAGWTAYPKRGRDRSSKATAKKLWAGESKLAGGEKALIAAIRRYSRSEDAAKEDGKYAPAFERWLKASRWQSFLEDDGPQHDEAFC